MFRTFAANQVYFRLESRQAREIAATEPSGASKYRHEGQA